MTASGGVRRPASLWDVVIVAIVASAFLVVVSLPRFGALNEPSNASAIEHTTAEGRSLQGLTIDAREYLRLTEYYAGDAPAPDLAPFNYRLGAPFVAGLLPWDSVFSLNLVVLSMLILGLVSMLLAQRRWNCGVRPLVLSAALYSISFPIFYWGSFSYVDGAVVGALGLVLALVAYERLVVAAIVVGLSMLLKEWALVGLFVLVAWIWFSRPRGSRWPLTSFAVLSAVLGFVASRLVAPTARTFYNPWIPSVQDVLDYIGWNTSQMGPIGQSALTAVPLAVALWVSWRAHRRGTLVLEPAIRAALLAGVGGALLLSVWAFLAAQWDGRAVWMAYPFALTYMALALSGHHPAPGSAIAEGPGDESISQASTSEKNR